MNDTYKDYEAAYRKMLKARKRMARKRCINAALSFLRISVVTWWRKRITRRCCASCAHWTVWEGNPAIGRCSATMRASPSTGKPLPTWKASGSYCEKWRERMR